MVIVLLERHSTPALRSTALHVRFSSSPCPLSGRGSPCAHSGALLSMFIDKLFIIDELLA